MSAGKLDFDDKVVCHRMCPCGTSLEPPSNAVAWEGLRNDGPPFTGGAVEAEGPLRVGDPKVAAPSFQPAYRLPVSFSEGLEQLAEVCPAAELGGRRLARRHREARSQSWDGDPAGTAHPPQLQGLSK